MSSFMEKTMKIGEIAQFLDISCETIRYYEKNGIVQPQRMNNSYREICKV
jgi:DNA-binding transcriptional MerR regulator